MIAACATLDQMVKAIRLRFAAGFRAAARGAAASAWGAPEDVAPGLEGDLVPPAVVGVSPVSGEAIALWNDPLTFAVPHVPASVRFSLRVPTG